MFRTTTIVAALATLGLAATACHHDLDRFCAGDEVRGRRGKLPSIHLDSCGWGTVCVEANGTAECVLSGMYPCPEYYWGEEYCTRADNAATCGETGFVTEEEDCRGECRIRDGFIEDRAVCLWF